MKRYDEAHNGPSNMVEHPEGEWVRYSLKELTAETRLAAANALLGDLATFALSRLDYAKLIPSDRKLFDELEDRLTAQRLHDHLVAQPAAAHVCAAPSHITGCFDGKCGWCGQRHGLKPGG